MKHKALVFILDGLGDRPCAALGGQTPLQAAATPTLDALARRGRCGVMDPLAPGQSVDTHTGVGILFGLEATEAARLRRGPVEAAGIDLPLRPGDICLRANFATLEQTAGGDKILDRRAGRIRERADELCAALRGLEVGAGITADVFPATQHRAVARLRGRNLSAQITDTDPGGDALARGVLASAPRDSSDAAAQTTADAVNDLTRRAGEILRAHPVNAARVAQGLPAANGIIMRSAGAHQPLKSRLSGRGSSGIKVAAVAGEMTVLGLARLLGFSAISDPRFTSLPDTDLGAKLRAAAAALGDHDLVFVHLKGSDTAAHDRDPELKSAFIARFDRELARLDLGGSGGPGGYLGDSGGLVVGVCADHATDSNTGEHNADPVPALLAGADADAGAGAGGYNETDCAVGAGGAGGALGRVTAEEYLSAVLQAMRPA